jgi:hypothetical protein
MNRSHALPPTEIAHAQTISVGGAEVVPAIPIVADSLMSPILIYIILTLLLLAIIWLVVGKIYGICGKKVIPTILLTGTIFYHL